METPNNEIPLGVDEPARQFHDNMAASTPVA